MSRQEPALLPRQDGGAPGQGPEASTSNDTIVACTLELPSQNLWVTLPGSIIVLRIRGGSLAARQRLVQLTGGTIAFGRLKSLLPPLAEADFRRINASPPELRADVGEWRISAIAPTPPFGQRLAPGVMNGLKDWVVANLVGPAAAA